jgi:peptidoglycan L-alanyl-D-glutamate endopeptidase CwlK
MTNKKDIAEQKGMGAVLNPPDNRDIQMSEVASALGIDTTEHPKKNITDISELPVEDQGSHGTCVGQAEGKGEEYRDLIETKKLVRGSKKFIYKHCKLVDGYSGQGTYSRVAAKVLTGKGMPDEKLVPDNNKATYEKYMSADVESPEILTDASQRRVKGYTFPITLNEMKTAIDLSGIFNASLRVGDWNQLPVTPKYSNGSDRGWHRILIYGYEDAKNNGKEDTKLYFRNSWGTNWAKRKTSSDRKLLKEGNGWFWYSEFVLGDMRDQIAYVDMPNEIIDYAKSKQFIFTRIMKPGMRGEDIRQLQKRLLTETALDGRPCFLYQGTPTTYFGNQTQLAVQRYQAKNGIVSSGTPQSTGYGQVGPKTLKSLNEGKNEPEVALYPVVGGMKNLLNGVMKATGHEIMVMSEYRSNEDQLEEFKKGREFINGKWVVVDESKVVTNAGPGESFHNWRCAFDVAFVKDGQPDWGEEHPWTMLGEIGEAIGLEWGGRWKSFPDRPHFQYTAGYSIEDFQNGKIDPKRFGEGLSENKITKTKMTNFIKTPITPAQIVFVMMAMAVIAAVFTDKINGQEFLTLASMAFAFYFVTPGQKKDEPAGSEK